MSWEKYFILLFKLFLVGLTCMIAGLFFGGVYAELVHQDFPAFDTMISIGGWIMAVTGFVGIMSGLGWFIFCLPNSR